jgi:hypothetical protein
MSLAQQDVAMSIYSNGVLSTLFENWSWANLNLQSSTYSHSGTMSIAMYMYGTTALYFQYGSPSWTTIDPTHWTYLELWVRGMIMITSTREERNVFRYAESESAEKFAIFTLNITYEHHQGFFCLFFFSTFVVLIHHCYALTALEQ